MNKDNVDKIVCIGKNYLEHAKELGDAVPARPVIFLKPCSVLVQISAKEDYFPVPLFSHQGAIHHETEIVIKLGKGGFGLTILEAETCIEAVTIGLDMTLRDKQTVLKKSGSPWTISKVFPYSAIIGPWISKSEFPDYMDTPFNLKINGNLMQQGTGNQMTLTPAECISYMSECFPLCEGDLIFTGTPVGVGGVTVGDRAEITWGNLKYSLAWNEFKRKN